MNFKEWAKDCIFRKLLGLPLKCPHCDKDLPKELEWTQQQ
tara:strand:+ start:178 stop:297 length:120 start_codon:yes stop_codon:yes gene_type:complete